MRVAKLAERIKADKSTQTAVCVQLLQEKTDAEEKALDAADLKALDELEALYPEKAAN